MSLDANRQILETSYRDLLIQWETVSAAWNDERSQDFEKTFLAPLRPDIMLAMEAFRELGQLVDKARKECQ